MWAGLHNPRQRASKSSKPEGASKKRKGILSEQSHHTITFLPAWCQLNIGGTARKENEPCCSREANKRNLAKNYEVEDHAELPTSSELPANSESVREISEPINEFQHFPPRKQIEEKQEKTKEQPPAKKQQVNKTRRVELKKKARRYKNKMAKRTEMQPTIWERTDESESEDDEIQPENLQHNK